MKVLKCPMCDRLVAVPRARKTCSQKCAQALVKRRDPNRYREIRAAAGKKVGARSRDRSIEHWAAKYPGVPVVTVRRILGAGYHAGWLTGRRTGFDNGYAAAEAAMRMRRPA